MAERLEVRIRSEAALVFGPHDGTVVFGFTAGDDHVKTWSETETHSQKLLGRVFFFLSVVFLLVVKSPPTQEGKDQPHY